MSAFDNPLLSGLLGDAQLSALFSAEADLAAMLRFETALAQAQAETGVIDRADAEAIAVVLAAFSPDVAALAADVATDGVVVPGLVRQLRAAVGGAAAEKVHFGATSQDVIDTSLMLRLKTACACLSDRLEACIAGLGRLSHREGDRPLMAYTRMQAAIPITVNDRVRSWQDPLMRSAERLDDIRQGFAVQFGGAAGTLEKLGARGAAVRAALARGLDLADRPQWQSQRDGLAEFAGLLSLITGALGKFGQDVALMAEVGGAIKLSGGGSSSAMPHKQNPVAAEVLVALARFNAVQISGMHQSLVHEQERSGAAWMLEWLLLPQMVVATGAALATAGRLIGAIGALGRD